MSFCRREGKDIISFVTKEDHEEPSSVELPEMEPAPGLIMADGSINWNCPCLGGMATGPCGVEFREAFSCFHYSTTTPKGTDCYGPFQTMHTCMGQYPNLYNANDGDKDDDSFSIINVEDSEKMQIGDSETSGKDAETQLGTVEDNNKQRIGDSHPSKENGKKVLEKKK